MKELRIGLVLYGGVSLAVYMNGIVSELWYALRASRTRADGSSATGGGTAAVYGQLLDELAATPGCDDLRIVVDAIAGTSAGGVNGAALARAISDGADASVLNRVWIEQADISALRGTPSAAPWTVRSLVWLASRIPPLTKLRCEVEALPGLSLQWLRDTLYTLFTTRDGRATALDGRYFTRVIAKAFGEMMAGGGGPPLLPHRGTLDLFLTATDFHGWPRHLPVMPEMHTAALFERTHAHVTAFRQRPGGSSIGDDFDLTFAARTTAGFPGAFAPVCYEDVVEDFAEARPQDFIPSADVFTRRHLREHLLAAFPGERAWMVDGGVLDNKPFSQLAQAIEDKPADYQVYRMVIHIEPDPEIRIDLPPRNMPLPIGVLKGLYSLFRHEPVYEDLRRLHERNSKVERIKAVVDANAANARSAASAAGIAAGLPWPPQPSELERWREVTNAAAARDPLSGYPGYVALKLRGAADVFSQIICSILEYPYHCRHAYFVRTMIRLWLVGEKKALELSFSAETGSAAAGPMEAHRLPDAQMELLGAFDIPFRIRRLRALAQAVNSAYADLPADPAQRRLAGGQLDACKEALSDIAFSFERLLADVDDLRESASSALSGISTDEIDGLIADLELGPETALKRHASAIDAIYRTLARRFSEAGNALNSRIPGALALLPASACERVANVFVTFPFTDLVSFPMMATLGVTDLIPIRSMRISPQDATFLSQDPHRLQGRRLGAFAGFLQRSAREHDLLWGRMDGAERLIALIVRAAAQSPGSRADTLQAIHRKYTARALAAILDEEAARPGSQIVPAIESLRLQLKPA